MIFSVELNSSLRSSNGLIYDDVVAFGLALFSAPSFAFPLLNTVLPKKVRKLLEKANTELNLLKKMFIIYYIII